VRLEESNDISESFELLMAFLARTRSSPTLVWVLTATSTAREPSAPPTRLRLRECVPDVTEVALDAIAPSVTSG
jgi:hypothetical protein